MTRGTILLMTIVNYSLLLCNILSYNRGKLLETTKHRNWTVREIFLRCCFFPFAIFSATIPILLFQKTWIGHLILRPLLPQEAHIIL